VTEEEACACAGCELAECGIDAIFPPQSYCLDEGI
jgi:hypothetical protein